MPPTIRLLKSIVVAIVDDRMQFDEFLAAGQEALRSDPRRRRGRAPA
ncbi:MAG: hypothetical protein V9G29_15395 [Burkholderiaceae bacterium]